MRSRGTSGRRGARRRATSSRASTRRRGSASSHNPIALLRGLPQDAPRPPGRRRELRRERRARRAPPRRLRQRPRLAGAGQPRRGRHAGGLLLAGVRPRRRHPALLGRPRHPRRRPPEVGLRPRRAAGRRGPALPQRLLPPVARPRRRPARALPGHRLVGPPADATRLGPDGQARRRSRWRSATRTCGPPCAASRSAACPLLLLDADIDGNSPRAREITERPLRRRPRPAHAPGGAARHRRRPRPRGRGHDADGLPHERGPLGAARAGAHAGDHRRAGADAGRGPRAGGRLDGLHHPHAGAGRQRDLRPRARARLPRAPRGRGRHDLGRPGRRWPRTRTRPRPTSA